MNYRRFFLNRLTLLLNFMEWLNFVAGTVLGTHEDNRYRSESKKSNLKSLDILGLGSGPELEKKLKYAEDLSSGIIFGKELVNSPANVVTPGSYECCHWHCACLLIISLSCSNLLVLYYAFVLTYIPSGVILYFTL